MTYFFDIGERYISTWWYLLVRGLLTLFFGLLILMDPNVAAQTFLVVVALALLFDGVFILLTGVFLRATQHLYQIMVTRGTLEIAFGVVALIFQGSTLRALAIVFTLLLIFRGVLEFITFVETDAPVRHQRIMLISSLATIIIGLYLLFVPLDRRVAIALLTAAYCLVEGVSNLTAAWRAISGTSVVSEQAAQRS